MNHPEDTNKMVLSCPSCGQQLQGGTSDVLSCSGNNAHVFTLPALLLAQSIQAGTLFKSGLELLNQQVKLVRAVALEQSMTKPDAFLKLEVKADELEKALNFIREAIKTAYA